MAANDILLRMQANSKYRHAMVVEEPIVIVVPEVKLVEVKPKKKVGRPRKEKPVIPFNMMKVCEAAEKIKPPKVIERVILKPKSNQYLEPAPFIRPKAVYDNKSPFGIATELRQLEKSG
jgi:hypothetical protein